MNNNDRAVLIGAALIVFVLLIVGFLVGGIGGIGIVILALVFFLALVF